MNAHPSQVRIVKLARWITPCLALALSACETERPAAPSAPARENLAAFNLESASYGQQSASASGGVGVASTTLPFAGSVSSGLDAWDIEQTGTGKAGVFRATNNNIALLAEQSGGGIAQYAYASGTGLALSALADGGGTAGVFTTQNTLNSAGITLRVTTNAVGTGFFAENTNPSNSSPAAEVNHRGAGHALRARAEGGGSAGLFELTQAGNTSPALDIANGGTGRALLIRNQNTGNSSPALEIGNAGTGTSLFVTSGGGTTARFLGPFNGNPTVEAISSGSGAAVRGFANNLSTGPAGAFEVFTGTSTSPALDVKMGGTAPAVIVDHTGSSGPLAVFRLNGANQIRFSRTGRGFFNGGTQTGGADIAEAFNVEGEPSAYEPGDVLVISTQSDRRVTKAGASYSTRVIGVYATKPGVLLTERTIDESLSDMVPVGVLGVIPTKVSAENGAIRRGDLLVTARKIGHAMRADPDRLRFGMVLGKALEEFVGTGTSVIKVLVNVK